MRMVKGRKSWGRVAGLAAVAIAVAVAVVSCTSDYSSNSAIPGLSENGIPSPAALSTQRAAAADAEAAPGTAGGAVAAASAPKAAPDQAAVGSAGSLPAAGQIAAPTDGSKVIRTADLSVRLEVAPAPGTADPTADQQANVAARSAAVAQAGTSVRGIAGAAGGYLASADGGASQLTVTVRIPDAQYDTVLEKLTEIGDVTSRTESAQDVTAEVVDVNSRVDSMTASVARVRALLAQATDIADVISIESELSVREANLESLQQQQAALSGQVALSTISLSITAVTNDPQSIEPVASESGFVTGLNAGWAALDGFASWLGVVLGALLPFLPLLAAAVLGWWLLRLTRRRRTAAAAAAAAAAAVATPGENADSSSEKEAEPAGAGVV